MIAERRGTYRVKDMVKLDISYNPIKTLIVLAGRDISIVEEVLNTLSHIVNRNSMPVLIFGPNFRTNLEQEDLEGILKVLAKYHINTLKISHLINQLLQMLVNYAGDYRLRYVGRSDIEFYIARGYFDKI